MTGAVTGAVTGAALWDRFVAAGAADAARLAGARGDELVALGHVAFRIGLSSLGMGAEPVGRLALAIERALDRAQALDEAGRSELAGAIATLAAAFHQLAHPDQSGARVEDLPLAEQTAALEAATAGAAAGVGAGGAPPAAAAGFAQAPASATPEAAALPVAAGAAEQPRAAAFTWVPTVDDDMIELFFDEAAERLEALAGKLVEVERRPADAELVRDVFRDLHTVKGSSAMVGLAPINHLAHAAEDLVGQIRDAGRAADGPAVDALLAALDGLRAMLDAARARAPIAFDPAPVIARLRNPGAPSPAAAPAGATSGTGTGTGTGTAPAASASGGEPAADKGRPTIRVDFEKLDTLLNLVGELVLDRDELRSAVAALGSLTQGLTADRGVARKVAGTRAASVRGGAAAKEAKEINALGDELSRVERVLGELAADLGHGTDRLDQISGELREQVMRLRMVPVAGVFRKHVRTVRDLAAQLGKRARLELVGDDTELDKLLVEALDEPLMHLVRNSVDHGLEPPEPRAQAGKPAEGVVRLVAAHRGNQVEIRVSDDGRGLDPDRLRQKAVERGLCTAAEAAALDDAGARALIFRAGFSTAATVSEVSGRGVGMDVVRQTIVTRLKGTIDIESTLGQGSTFVLKLPLTLAIIQVLVARAGGETFAIPLDVVQRVLAIQPGQIELVGDREVCVVRGKHVPMIRLDAVLELGGAPEGELQLVMVEQGGQPYALVCDHLLGKREIVIKSLGKLLAAVPCVAGATLLGDRVALILDVPAIIKRAGEQARAPGRASRPAGPGRAATAALAARAGAGTTQILLVEDSDIVRESLRRLLADAGYLVTVAIDGQHGLELARARRFDLVSTDVVMPRLDGYELTRALRALPEYANVPIVMVTSMGERIDRVRGFDAGIDEYITKPHDRTQLLRVVQKLLGHGHGHGHGGHGSHGGHDGHDHGGPGGGGAPGTGDGA
ncbi:MAG TPA: hybrid sensor histidine kinase/response regulator [Kofleriaceae bacterium]|nr:hybrid sensor histidine kinase/response regulator [Kofleriaceae bacterium]